MDNDDEFYDEKWLKNILWIFYLQDGETSCGSHKSMCHYDRCRLVTQVVEKQKAQKISSFNYNFMGLRTMNTVHSRTMSQDDVYMCGMRFTELRPIFVCFSSIWASKQIYCLHKNNVQNNVQHAKNITQPILRREQPRSSQMRWDRAHEAMKWMKSIWAKVENSRTRQLLECKRKKCSMTSENNDPSYLFTL